MAKALQLSCYTPGWTTTANTTFFWPIGAGGAIAGSATASVVESINSTLYRTAGTFTELGCHVSANTIAATSTLSFRINAADGAMTISIGSTATGDFVESSPSSDTIVAGDKVALKSVPGAATNTMIFTSHSINFAATTDTVSRMINLDFNSITSASATFFENLGGFTPATHGTETTESQFKCRQRKAGTFKNACIDVWTNTHTACTVTSRKNGVNGAVTLTIADSTTGFIEDTVNTDTVAAGDDYNWTIVTGTGTNALTILSWCIDFVTTTDIGQMVLGSRTGETVADATNKFFGICGFAFPNTTEVSCRAMLGWTFSELTILVSANDVSSASSYTLRLNTANSLQIASVTGSTTGAFSDSTHTTVTVTTDVIAANLTVPSVAGSHNVTLRNASIWSTAPAAAVVAARVRTRAFTLGVNPRPGYNIIQGVNNQGGPIFG